MTTPDVFDDDDQPIAWFRLTIGYMRPGTRPDGTTYQTSRVNWHLETGVELPPEDITFGERNSWRVWGDGEGQDVGTSLGSTILGELLPMLSWWAGHAEREQLAYVAAANGKPEPPPPVRVRLVPMVTFALLEQAAVDLPELDRPELQTAEEVNALIRAEVLAVVQAEHRRQRAELHELLLEAQRLAKHTQLDDLQRVLEHAVALTEDGPADGLDPHRKGGADA